MKGFVSTREMFSRLSLWLSAVSVVTALLPCAGGGCAAGLRLG